MKTRRLLLLMICFLLFLGFAATQPTAVSALSAYKTFTLDRNGRLQETNEAYEAIQMIRTFSDGSTLNGAKDLTVDEEDYLYIADTGNKRILILDPAYQVVAKFGSDKMQKPMGIAVVDDVIYIADYGQAVTNQDIGAIHIYNFDKEAADLEDRVTFVKSLSTPTSSLLDSENFLFRPMKIAVDQNQTMYVTNEGTTNGVLMINQENRFINYFASNPIKISLWKRLQRILYQNNPNVNLAKNIPVPVTNIALDNRGYYYTVTSTIIEDNQGDNIKKVNTGGTNFYPDDMFTHGSFVDSWPGDVGNLYAVTSGGTIVEYDSLGNLLFQFAGLGTGNDRLGLFLSASAIAQNTQGNLFVIDDNSSRNALHIFQETPFAVKVHDALRCYNDAEYVESIDIWTEVLRYNSMFDMAYRGIGLGYLMNEEYELALDYFEIANAKAEYSEAYWEIRNIWLIDHIDGILLTLLLLVAFGAIIHYTNKKFAFLSAIKQPFQRLLSLKYPREMAMMFRFVRHPFDTCYEVKRRNRVSTLSGFIFLIALVGLYLIGMVLTGFIFNQVIIEETVLFNEIMKLVLPFLIFVLSNYLVSSLMEGEGTMRAVFLNSLGALTPIFLIYPLVILLSNVITLNESFLYSFGLTFMFLWSLGLIYFNIKETHNYTVGQTIVNLLLTLLMMIVIIITLIIVYLMVFQVGTFVSDIVKEVIIRE